MTSLKTYTFDQNLVLGANVSLQDCISIFTDAAKNKSEFAYLAEFAKHFDLIAHIPVRTVSIHGLDENIMSINALRNLNNFSNLRNLSDWFNSRQSNV